MRSRQCRFHLGDERVPGGVDPRPPAPRSPLVTPASIGLTALAGVTLFCWAVYRALDRVLS